MNRFALSAAIWAAFSFAAAGADRWEVTAHVDIFQLPEKDAFSVIPRLSDPHDSTAALNLLAEESTEVQGNVQRVASLTARAPEGHSAAIRSGEERKYPIEYEQEDPRIGVPTDAPIKVPDATGYPATTFETRECGTRLEFSAKVHPNGESMLLLCSVQHSLFDGWTRYETAVRDDGMKLFLDQPEFIQRKSSNNALLSPGKPILLGSYRMLEKEGMFELHVLTAKIRRVDDVKFSRAAPLTDEMKALLPALFPKRDMRLEVLTFSVSAREAIALRGQLLNEKEADRALATMIAQAGSEVVRLVDWQTIPSVAGGRAVAENYREFRYGIEHDTPSHIPGPFADVQFYNGPAWQGEPCIEPLTTFESRNLGTLLEVECELKGAPHSTGFEGEVSAKPGTYDRVRLRSSNVALSHFLRWGAGPNRNGKVSYVYQPQFTNRAFSGVVAIENRKPLLIRFAKEPGASNRFEIAVLRAHERHP